MWLIILRVSLEVVLGGGRDFAGQQARPVFTSVSAATRRAGLAPGSRRARRPKSGRPLVRMAFGHGFGSEQEIAHCHSHRIGSRFGWLPSPSQESRYAESLNSSRIHAYKGDRGASKPVCPRRRVMGDRERMSAPILSASPTAIARAAGVFARASSSRFRPRPSTGWAPRGQGAKRWPDLCCEGPPRRPSADRSSPRRCARVTLGARFSRSAPTRSPTAFWPGPLTLICPAATSRRISSPAGRTASGLRVPSHPVARELLASFGDGIAAPSANRFGRISPTTARHVADDSACGLLILDGGACVGRHRIDDRCVRQIRPCCCDRAASRVADLERCSAGRSRRATASAPRAPGTLPVPLCAADARGIGRARCAARRARAVG